MNKKLIPKGQWGWVSKVKDAVRESLNTAGEYYDKFSKAMNTAYTTTALDEMGHPIIQANGKMAQRTSTPKKDVTAAVTGITLPVSAVTVGVPATVGGIVGGMATGYIGNKAGRKVAKAVGANEKAQEMAGDVGGFVGSIPGGVAGAKVGKTVEPILFGPDGKMFNSQMVYNPRNWYRGVAKDAITDANNSGVIRGQRLTWYDKAGNMQSRRDVAYFGRGEDAWNRGYIIEGTPEGSQWAQTLGHHEGQPFKFMPKERIDSKLGYNSNGNPYEYEAFPTLNGQATTPITNFQYYKKYPLLGWRQKQFKSGYHPTTVQEMPVTATNLYPEQASQVLYDSGLPSEIHIDL